MTNKLVNGYVELIKNMIDKAFDKWIWFRNRIAQTKIDLAKWRIDINPILIEEKFNQTNTI